MIENCNNSSQQKNMQSRNGYYGIENCNNRLDKYQGMGTIHIWVHKIKDLFSLLYNKLLVG